MNRHRRLIGICLSILATSVAPQRSWAGPSEQAAAQALFDEGQRLMGEGKYAEACPKLAESQKLDPAPGTLLYLGDCYEKNGQTASAWATFQAAMAATRQAKQPEREKIARDRMNRLTPLLCKMNIALASPEAQVADLQITRNGAPVAPATLGIPVPVDPGEQLIEAKAPGKKTWSTKTAVTERGATVTVTVPVLEAEPAPPASTPPASTPPAPATPADTPVPGLVAEPPTATTTDQGTTTSTGTTQRVFAWIVGGLGIVGLGAGTGFALAARQKDNDSKSFCRQEDPSRCMRQGLVLNNDAKRFATAANIGFIAGGTLLAGGVVLFLTAPSGKSSAPASASTGRLRLQSHAGRNEAGLTLSGEF